MAVCVSTLSACVGKRGQGIKGHILSLLSLLHIHIYSLLFGCPCLCLCSQFPIPNPLFILHTESQIHVVNFNIHSKTSEPGHSVVSLSLYSTQVRFGSTRHSSSPLLHLSCIITPFYVYESWTQNLLYLRRLDTKLAYFRISTYDHHGHSHSA